MAELANYVGRDTNLSGFYNSILRGIERQQEIAAKKQEAEDERARQIVKGMEGELSKVSSDGLRPADIGLFNQSYSKIKDSYYKMLTSRTNDERLQAAAEMRNAINATNNLVSRSKALGKQDYDIGEDIRKNAKDYADNVRTLYNQRINTSLDKLSPELLNPQNFARRIDTSKVQGNIIKMAQDIAKASDNVTPSVSRMNLPSGGADVVEFVREGSRAAFVEGMVQQTAADPAYQAYIRENFPGLSYEEAINLIADQMQEAGHLTSRSGRQVIRDRAPSSSDGSGGNSTAVGGLTLNVPVNLGGRKVNATRRVGTNISSVTIPPVRAVDAQTGQITDLTNLIGEGFTKGAVVSFSQIPEIRNILGEEEVAEIQVSQPNPDYAIYRLMGDAGAMAAQDSGVSPNIVRRFYVGQDVVPRTGTNQKAINQALTTLRSGVGQESTSQNNSVSSQPTNATISVAEQMRRAAQKK